MRKESLVKSADMVDVADDKQENNTDGYTRA